MPNYSSSVGIVGGGITGLIAGCTLQEQGIKTVVFERSKSLNTDGAGITISPNGLRVLQKLQIKDHLVETSFLPNKILFHQKNTNITKIRVLMILLLHLDTICYKSYSKNILI